MTTARTTYRLADLPIFVDANGKPIPGRPEHEPGPTANIREQIDYARAVDAYRDRAYSRAGRAFALAFTMAVGCFHEADRVDPNVDGGTDSTGGNGAVTSWSGSGSSADSGSSTGPDLLPDTGDTSTRTGSVSSSGTGRGSSSGTGRGSSSGTGRGSSSGTGRGSFDGSTGDPPPPVYPCDAQCSTCLDAGLYEACSDTAPCADGFEPTPETELCYLPCTDDADCPEGPVCVWYSGPHGQFQGCLWVK